MKLDFGPRAQPTWLVWLAGGGALALYGVRNAPRGIPLALLGGGMIYHGLTRRPGSAAQLGQPHEETFSRVVTINRPADDLYDCWRDLTCLPQIAPQVDSVQARDDTHVKIGATFPYGWQAAWELALTEDQTDRMVTWQSLPDAPLPHSVNVQFRPAAGGRGTELAWTLRLMPRGPLGKVLAPLVGAVIRQQIAAGLTRFKQLIETGQITTTRGQPSGRAESAGEVDAVVSSNSRRRPEQVQKASEDSFPASDPPSWGESGVAAPQGGTP